jgi:hypothetical protein
MVGLLVSRGQPEWQESEVDFLCMRVGPGSSCTGCVCLWGGLPWVREAPSRSTEGGSEHKIGPVVLVDGGGGTRGEGPDLTEAGNCVSQRLRGSRGGPHPVSVADPVVRGSGWGNTPSVAGALALPAAHCVLAGHGHSLLFRLDLPAPEPPAGRSGTTAR